MPRLAAASPGAPLLTIDAAMRARFSVLSAAMWRNFLQAADGDAAAYSWFSPEEHEAMDQFLRRRYHL